MTEQIVDLGKQDLYLQLVALGVPGVTDGAQNRKWVTRINSPDTLFTIRSWSEKTRGIEVCKWLERWAMGVCCVADSVCALLVDG